MFFFNKFGLDLYIFNCNNMIWYINVISVEIFYIFNLYLFYLKIDFINYIFYRNVFFFVYLL